MPASRHIASLLLASGLFGCGSQIAESAIEVIVTAPASVPAFPRAGGRHQPPGDRQRPPWLSLNPSGSGYGARSTSVERLIGGGMWRSAFAWVSGRSESRTGDEPDEVA